MQNFTAMTMDLIKLQKEVIESEQNVAQEMQAYHAPSECAKDCYRSLERSIMKQEQTIMNRYGMTLDEWKTEAERRGISYRWIYFNVWCGGFNSGVNHV